jgi:hypothetical protein
LVCPRAIERKRQTNLLSDASRRSRRRHQLKVKYGITLEDYETMLVVQGGVCAICGCKRGAKDLHVEALHRKSRCDVTSWAERHAAQKPEPGRRQTCKVCGRPDKFNFHVSDRQWCRIVPKAYRGLVVCLACFDAFAYVKGADYALGALYFVGDQRIVEFRPVSDLEVG